MVLDTAWRKSSASMNNGACAEVRVLGNEWQKSIKCGGAPDCVEVRTRAEGMRVEVRNSKRPDAGSVVFTADEWTAFLEGAKLGEFDLDG